MTSGRIAVAIIWITGVFLPAMVLSVINPSWVGGHFWWLIAAGAAGSTFYVVRFILSGGRDSDTDNLA